MIYPNPFIRMTGKFQLKVWAYTFIVLMITQVFLPTFSWAMNGGPDAPEQQSFVPASMTNMVDPFTGDFTYNLPLMNVPGPNGGYPINLHYKSGIGMEQESSWTGLGWNINVGAINRQVSGIPDDFSGDEEISRTRYMRKNWTVDVNMNSMQSAVEATNPQYVVNQSLGSLFTGLDSPESEEIWGYEDVTVTATSLSASLSLNNYSGLGLGMSFNRNQATWESFGSEYTFSSLGAGIDLNSGQLSITKSFLDRWDQSRGKSAKLSNWIASLPGQSSLGLPSNRGYSLLNASVMLMSRPQPMPITQLPMTGISVGFEGSWWQTDELTPAPGDWEADQLGFQGSYNMQYIPDDKIVQTYDAFGLCYASSEDNGLSDFSLENDRGMTKRTPVLPMPTQNNDVWSITGQGIAGTFRAFRDDVGIYSPLAQQFETGGGDAGLEAGIPTSPGLGTMPTEFKVGLDAGWYVGSTYVGPWRSGNGLDEFSFQASSDHENETFYFRTIGESTASAIDELDGIRGEAPVAFDLAWDVPSSEGNEPLPSVKARASDYNVNGGSINNQFTGRKIRSKSIQYKTNGEIQNDNEVVSRSVSYVGGGSGAVHTSEFENQIGEMEVVNSAGMRYVYGIPVYNKTKVDVSFRVNVDDLKDASGGTPDFTLPDVNPNVVTWDLPEMGSTGYQGGYDHFFSKDETPEFTTSFLITEIYSADYVDLTGDGPSNDDFGYWCQFNYTKADDYGWRSPYKGGYYDKGDDSNLGDDMVSYSYGVREAYYLESIVTKTHEAKFYTSVREDNCPTYNELNQSPPDLSPGDNQIFANQQSRKLDKIELIAKNDLEENPIQTVEFTYNHSLCGGTYNSLNSNGKLTLEAVIIKYEDNNKGESTPYRFEYGSGDQNPSYDPAATDRWGNYHPTAAHGRIDKENPYVFQGDYPERHDHASAWCLREIHLPSGSWMNIEYESDDYSFVQDEDATQMFKIIGTSHVDDDITEFPSNQGFVRKNHRRIYFELPDPTVNDITAYTEGLNSVYFKTYLQHKFLADLSGQAEDYTEGWASIEAQGTVDTDLDGNFVGYIDLAPVNATVLGIGNCNPIQLAGWEYLRSSRSDLHQAITGEDVSLNDLGAVVGDMLNAFSQSVQQVVSFYGYAKIQGWSNKIMLNEVDRPSFVRLKNPNGRKYGGGCRVSKLTVRDNWTENNDYGEGEFNAEYGQEFSYVLEGEDGFSSGVAAFEPILGGEENALRKPIFFNEANVPVSLRAQNAFVENPVGESYFPAPVVGYSRVVVTSSKREISVNGESDWNFPSSGKTIHEFYTAKDFPTRVRRSNISQGNGSMVSRFLPIPIPTVGIQTFQNQGYSQGFYVETNDMHGKLKAVSVLPETAPPDASATTRTEYIYFTNPENPKRLNNDVNVLGKYGQVVTRTIGQSHDFFIHMAEHNHWNVQEGLQTGVQGWNSVILPSGQFDFEYAHSNFRSVATTKVVYRTGILQKVISFADGSFSESENLVFDSYSGAPILTKTNNEWEAPVYSYSYMGHLYYPGIQGAYQNYRSTFNADIDASGVMTTQNIDLSDFLYQGDELVFEDVNGDYHHLWVDHEDPLSNYEALNEDGTLFDGQDLEYTLTVIRSGHKNQHGTTVGSVVSLENPLDNRMLNLVIEGWNEMMQLTGATFESGAPPDGHFYVSCQGDQLAEFRHDGAGFHDDMQLGHVLPNECGSIIIDFEGLDDPTGSNWSLSTDGDNWILTDTSIPVSYTSPITEDHWEWLFCLGPACFDVLHAEAKSINDDWTYDYSGVGALEDGQDFSNNNLNPYRYGIKGIWRPYRDYVYQIGRIQSDNPTTDISTDGLYQKFKEFDWVDEDELDANEEWTWVSEATKYDPQGWVIEQKNALDISNSSLFGYDNSLVSASSGNAQQHEIGFESFEDHTDNIYASGHGNLNFLSGSPTISTTQAHTGQASLSVIGETKFMIQLNDPTSGRFSPNVSGGEGEYHFSTWVYTGNNDVGQVRIQRIDGTDAQIFSSDDADEDAIDGWTRISGNYEFDVQGGLLYEIYLETDPGEQIYFDDFRILPADASMQCHVYDASNLRLKASLDDNNYATFYDYDSEGKLVQTRIETVNGIQTISTSRSFIKPSTP